MTTTELIRSRIAALHAKGGGDWQTLMRQVDERYRTIPYNTSQMLALLVGDYMPTVKNLDLEWSRGTGKTTLLAAFARRIARDIPRGAYQWEVPTYQKFLTEIIPAFIHGLEMQGLYKDLHYFVGRRPPARWGWPEPYKPPMKYDNFIIFWTGFGINLLSQDNVGAGRGLSTDGRLASEAVMLDPQKLENESGPAIRGSNVKALGGRRYFNFRLMESSTPLTDAGEWYIKREEMAKEAPGKHQFMRANCVENIKLGWLAENYLTEGRRTAPDEMTFEARNRPGRDPPRRAARTGAAPQHGRFSAFSPPHERPGESRGGGQQTRPHVRPPGQPVRRRGRTPHQVARRPHRTHPHRFSGRGGRLRAGGHVPAHLPPGHAVRRVTSDDRRPATDDRVGAVGPLYGMFGVQAGLAAAAGWQNG